MDMKRAAEDFLRDNGMVCGVPAETLCERFREEMARGLRREPSTLMMLPSHLILGDGLPADGRAAALDMGGTNLRSALVTVERGKAQVELDVTGPTRERDAGDPGRSCWRPCPSGWTCFRREFRWASASPFQRRSPRSWMAGCCSSTRRSG